jgi:hypothetical protein
MKKFAVLIAFLIAAVQVSAQVTVEVLLDSEEYLPNEPLIARVRIDNASGSTLRFGDTPDWLSFVVETTEGPYVRPLRPPNVVGAFNLESSSKATKSVDLSPCFDLTKAGRYKIVATVKVPAFNTSFASPGKVFYIGGGSKLWERTFGVPPTIVPAGPNGEPELRKYILVQANSASETRLYARVTDARDSNIRVVPIGPLLSFSRPEFQMDKWSNLHIFYQNGAKSFLYSMINPEGFMIARERHEYTDTRPALTVNSEGRISIRGGARRYTKSDIPPVDESLIAPPETQAASTPYEEVAVGKSKGKSGRKPAPPENAKEKKKQ